MEIFLKGRDFAIHCFSFEPIDSRMYVVLKEKQALIIDPCISREMEALLLDQETEQILVIPTHEHYDHISGINRLKKNYPCRVLASEYCAKGMEDANSNMSNFYEVMFMTRPEEVIRKARESCQKGYVCKADEVFEGRHDFVWNGLPVAMKETPGHSPGSICIELDDCILFTGDSLVNGSPVITRLPGGSKKNYREITLPYLRGMPPDMMIMPGHGAAAMFSEFML